jgi:hypothetical protein
VLDRYRIFELRKLAQWSEPQYEKSDIPYYQRRLSQPRVASIVSLDRLHLKIAISLSGYLAGRKQSEENPISTPTFRLEMHQRSGD